MIHVFSSPTLAFSNLKRFDRKLMKTDTFLTAKLGHRFCRHNFRGYLSRWTREIQRRLLASCAAALLLFGGAFSSLFFFGTVGERSLARASFKKEVDVFVVTRVVFA